MPYATLPPLAAIRALKRLTEPRTLRCGAGWNDPGGRVISQSLEERMGSPLFVRERGRVRLTPLGSRLLPALSNAFDTIESAFASHREEDESLLTISTTHTFANTWLAWRLGAFQMEHTDLAVRMTTSNEICDCERRRDCCHLFAADGWEGWNIPLLNRASPRCSPAASPKRAQVGRKLTPTTCPTKTHRPGDTGFTWFPTIACRRTWRCCARPSSGFANMPRSHASLAAVLLC